MGDGSLDGLGRPAPPAPESRGAGRERGYPRPQLRREGWRSLDGPWQFAIDRDGALTHPDDVVFDAVIEVPFAPETQRSGIGDGSFYRAVWYRRAIEVPPVAGRLWLHFGAVDYEARVYVDGVVVGHHEGGYTPFSIDITACVAGRDRVTIVVRAEDDPADLAKPRGKQDWRREPHSIWYPRTTGIWQTVWLEEVPEVHVAELRWTSSLERWEIGLEARIGAPPDRQLRLRVELRAKDVILADDSYAIVAGEVARRIALSDPGIDDFRNALLWSPESPTLIRARIELADEHGTVFDRVESYTALRSVSVQGGRFVLNGRPYPLRLVLDQGYWPETGLTPPDDEALRRDVELTKAMGFNGARKHQKIEDPRYLHWATKLGLLVWEEMPSAYRFTRRSVERLVRQWTDAVLRDASQPCIVAWVPFNESWGVPNLPDNAAERHYVQALYHLTHTLDPSRPVVGNDGWEHTATDIVSIHDYEADPARLAERYRSHDVRPTLLARGRTAGRQLVLAGHEVSDAPLVLSEFGGIALGDPRATWGYARENDGAGLAQRYAALLAAITRLELFAGFCYTQLTDTYQEANGLLYADRTPKVPLARLRRATEAGYTHIETDGPHAPAAEGEP